MAHGVPFGALTIYADQPGVFGAAEMESLTNLAEILSFGITSLRERQQTELALREISELNQQVISDAHEGIIVYDQDLRCQLWNPYMEELTGIPAQEVVGSLPFEKFPFLPKLGAEPGLRKALAGRANVSDDLPLRRPQSERTFWVSGRHSPLRNRFGQITKVLATVRDVTERREAEEALRQSERRLRQAARVSQIGIFEHDHITDTIYWSPEQRKTYGFGPDKVVTLPVYLDHVYAEDREAMAAAVRRAHDPAGDGLFDVDHRIVSADGSLRWLTTRAQTFFEGEGEARHKVRTIGAVLDITERKRAEEQLRLNLQQATFLWKIGRLLSGSRSVDHVVHTAVDGATEHLGCDVALFFQKEGETLQLQAVGSSDPRFTPDAPLTHCVGQCLCGLAARDGEPIYCIDIFNDPRCTWEECKKAALRSFAALPLKNADRVIGVLGVASGTQRDFEKEASFLETLTAQVALALANAHSYQEMTRLKENFRLLFEQAPDGIFLADAQGHFLDANLAGVRTLGHSLDEIRGMTIADIVAPEEIERIAPAVARLAGGEVVTSEWRFLRKDGSCYEGELVARQLPDGKLLGIVRDVTDRKRAEQALREAEEKYRGIFESAVVGIFQSDLNGRYLSVNPAMARMLGYGSPQELLTSITDISREEYVDPESRKAFQLLVEQQGVVQNFERQVYRKDGSKIWISVNAHAVRKDGVVIGYEGTYMDITERKLLEAELRQVQKMEAVGRLAGGVAHDFHNILGVIIGYADLSLSRFAPEDEVNRYQAQIKKAADRAVSLTQQLLAFSRRQIVFPKPLDLNAVVHNMITMLLRMVREDIAISFQPTTPIDSINADQGQIEQILMNLVVNARDAMPSGGQITIETGHAELDEHFTTHNPGSRAEQYVVLTVSDTGCGMDEDTRSHIFEPFFTTKEIGQGTGLGLSTVYGIVKQSGGYIWVYSEPGKGTTFKIYFPRVAGRAEEPVPSHKEAELPRGSETILVVEDDETLRELAVRLLQDAGYQVIEATNAEIALDILQVKPGIDLLLTDVIMPGKSGVELLGQAKALCPNLRAVFMSGYPGGLVALRGGLMPEAAFLEKPFNQSSLLTKVYSALHSKSAKLQSH